jgi:hypothetical protein
MLTLGPSGSTNCVTQTLTNIQGVVGTVNLTTFITLVTGTSLTNIPTNITCTDCLKAIYNEVNQAIPSLVSDAVPALQSECGASFVSKTLSNASLKIQRTDLPGS